MKPLAIDLYCGLGGWSEGLIAEGWRVVGFDIERHLYGEMGYPAQLVLQDVLTLHGSQFKDADLIVASPPCQEYSYMAMPWTRAKQIERALLGRDEFPEGYTGSRTVAELNALFDACFRIQREASEAAGRHIPLVVENVCGAQKWVGPAKWRHGSYYLWGDVPALMPVVTKRRPMKEGIAHRSNGATNFHQGRYDGVKVGGLDWSSPDKSKRGCFRDSALKNTGGSWFNIAHNTTSGKGRNPDGRDNFGWSKESDLRNCNSGSRKRKAASALIAKIPFELARHVAAVYRPEVAA